MGDLLIFIGEALFCLFEFGVEIIFDGALDLILDAREIFRKEDSDNF